MTIITLVYLVWRALYTIDPGSRLLGIPLLAAEIWGFLTALLFTFTLWDLDAAPLVEPQFEGEPIATVLIPTYNEPIEVLLPVIAAAKRMKRVKEVWVLDDGKREWVAAACKEAGVVYRTRPDHEYAKAGNLNAALPDVTTELLLVLDADHVASPDFIPKVARYFDDPKVAVVQTPQDFYNQDSFEHEMLGDRLFNEEELFYRGMLTGRNRWNAAFWCGTGGVVRTEALRDVGGVATESVTEDILTSIRMHRKGWKSVHHNEVLARGLAAANAEQYLAQRLRWGSGAMQVLRSERFMLRKGLTFSQRLSYIATLTGWFDSWRAFTLLVLPSLSLLLAATVLTGPWQVFVILFTITFLLQRFGMSRLARGRANIWESTVFDAIRLPATLASTIRLVWPRPLQFKVTSKGKQGTERRRARVPWLLIGTNVLIVASLVYFILHLLDVVHVTSPQESMAWVHAGWSVLNLIIVSAAIRRIRESRFASERRASTRISVSGDAWLNGVPVKAADLSIGGAQVISPQAFERFTEVTLKARDLEIRGTVTNRTVREEDFVISIRYYAGQEILAAQLTSPVMV